MIRPNEVHRIFHRSDDEVLQQSDFKLASFIENKGPFVERFPNWVTLMPGIGVQQP